MSGPRITLPLILTLATLCCGVTGSQDASGNALLQQARVAGGLIVHIGCGDGQLTADLRPNESALVHGLALDPRDLVRAREQLKSLGLYGPVSIGLLEGERLPYADGLVNLVVNSAPGAVADTEIQRVLAPGGSLLTKTADGWALSRKPVPADTDGWQHALHGADNNAVAADERVGPPRRVQWVAEPRNTRHHEHLASVSAVVSSGGRLVYIADEAPIMSMFLRPQWSVICRDAYNGVTLWKRPIQSWESYMRSFRSGPPELCRRLVATDAAVYVTLAYDGPVVALDALTGETVRTYDATAPAREILYDDGMLYVLCGPEAPEKKRLVVLDARSGQVRWQLDPCPALPTTPAVRNGRLFYQDAQAVVCLDSASGAQLWRSPRFAPEKRPGWSAPTLVACDEVVLCADRRDPPKDNTDEKTGRPIARWLTDEGPPGELVALSARTGEQLWSCLAAETYHAPVDVFVADGLVWVGQSRSRTGPDLNEGRDLLTGEIRRRLVTDEAFDTTMPHHRCHRNRATERYLVTGRTGVEFIDVRSGECEANHWTRGVCQYGVLPCNGLLYVPPHSCACYIEAKIAGFYALAPDASSTEAPVPPLSPAELPGPAFDAAGAGAAAADPADWPTYRHDPARSGTSASSVPTALAPLWEAKLGGKLTSPVVVGDVLCVASSDTHTVHALTLREGAPLWGFTAEGRIDSPPTFAAGRALFGSADGHVYCLRASDGQLVWRFRAAPDDRRIVSEGQLESAWPVCGSVLVDGGVVYCAAGRSSYLDGGIRLCRIDLATGRLLRDRILWSRDPVTGDQPDEPIMFEMAGALPDVLSTDGEHLFMRQLTFDARTLEDQPVVAHLYSPAGFLNGDWWHRTYWLHGTHFYSGYIGWYFAGREATAGRILSVDPSSIYGFGYKPQFYRGATERQYHLFAVDRAEQPPQPDPDYARANRDYPHSGQGKFGTKFRWATDVPHLVRGLALTPDALFTAGPPDSALQSMPAFRGDRGGLLQVFATGDGNLLADYRLDGLPVFDGLIAAQGRLLLATEDGRVLCMGDPAEAVANGPAFLRKAPDEAEIAARTPVEPGLVGHWKLDEGEGELAADSSGLGRDAEVYGAWVTGEFGACLKCAGIPGSLSIADGPALHFGAGDFSLSFWTRPDSYDQRIMGKERFPENWWVINLLPDGRAELVLGQSTAAGKSVRPTTKSALPTDRWTHLAFVVDRQNRQVHWYVNGALDNTTAIPDSLDGALDVEGADLRIPSAHKPYTGLFDELRIYKRVLSSEEIAARYLSEAPTRGSVEYQETVR